MIAWGLNCPELETWLGFLDEQSRKLHTFRSLEARVLPSHNAFRRDFDIMKGVSQGLTALDLHYHVFPVQKHRVLGGRVC